MDPDAVEEDHMKFGFKRERIPRKILRGAPEKDFSNNRCSLSQVMSLEN